MLVKSEGVKLYLKLVPGGLLTKRTKPSKLQEINPIFDAQNMKKNTNDKIFSGFIQFFENFVL